jgi:hypothetical protein
MADSPRPSSEVYRLNMAKLPLAVGRAWRFEVLRILVAATVLTALLTALADTPREALDASAVVLAIVVVALPYQLWRTARMIRRYWNAFELAVGAEAVRVAAKGGGRVTIRRDEIASVLEGARGLIVTSVQPGVFVDIPNTVEAYSDVRARLAALRPIAPRPETFGWIAALVFAGLVITAAAAFPQVPGGLAIGLVLCQVAGAVVVAGEVRSNPALPSARRALVVLVAIVVALLPVGGLFLR